MALFQMNGKQLTLIRPANFNLEKDIQALIEKNLETVFNSRFVATEFPTGSEHAGRIDTLALSEDNNPVIIEYKKVESSELINQSLYYLSWIKDHRGDFQIAANQALGKNVEIDWTDVRVICIAPGYKKYDLHAVQMMGANIELWQYRLFENGAFYLEEIFRRSTSLTGDTSSTINGKNPVMVAAGKKAAMTRITGSYSFEGHIKNIDKDIKEIVLDLRDYILSIDESVEESPKKYFIAYKVAQNFVCMEVKKTKINLYLKLDPSEIKEMPENARDVRDIGHYGTGDFELTIRKKEEAETGYKYIKMAFERIGG
jgi:predicted transport protein